MRWGFADRDSSLCHTGGPHSSSPYGSSASFILFIRYHVRSVPALNPAVQTTRTIRTKSEPASYTASRQALISPTRPSILGAQLLAQKHLVTQVGWVPAGCQLLCLGGEATALPCPHPRVTTQGITWPCGCHLHMGPQPKLLG